MIFWSHIQWAIWVMGSNVLIWMATNLGIPHFWLLVKNYQQAFNNHIHLVFIKDSDARQIFIHYISRNAINLLCKQIEVTQLFS